MKTSLTMSRNMAMIASLILGAMQAAAQTTIYSDNFVGSSSTSLNGAAVQNSPLGPENWTLNNTTAYSAWNADGSVVNGGSATASQNESSILLPFTPVAGNVYTLKGTVNVTSSSTWMGLGFSTALSNASGAEGDFAFGSGLNGVAWVLQNGVGGGNGNVLQGFNGPGTGNIASSTYGPNVNTITITLDTTGAQWKDTLYAGGGNINTTYTFASNPTINAVGFTKYNGASGSISAFSLTVTPAPEPATLSLGLLGGLSLLVAAKRFRRA